jgi:uncharacterized protein YjfI (DUF2170 family)
MVMTHFFQLQDGVLTLGHEGTIDTLKQTIEDDKKTAISNVEKGIEELKAKLKELEENTANYIKEDETVIKISYSDYQDMCISIATTKKQIMKYEAELDRLKTFNSVAEIKCFALEPVDLS